MVVNYAAAFGGLAAHNPAYQRFATKPLNTTSYANQTLASLSAAMSHPSASKQHEKSLPHQDVAVHYALTAGRCLIADQPGMGKTAEAILTMNASGIKRALIVAPAVTLDNWAGEMSMWSNGKHDQKIVSWEYMTTHVGELRDFSADLIVFDEAHYAVRDSARTAAAIAVQNKQDFVLAMTGTPHVTSVLDIKSLARLIGKDDDKALEDMDWFMLNGRDDPRKLEELEMLVRGRFMLRRTKKQLGLADPTIDIIPLEPDDEYAVASADLISYFEERKKPGTALNLAEWEITRGTLLDEIAASGMVEQAAKWIREKREAEPDKWVVFASHKNLAEQLAELMADYTLLGRDSHAKRRRMALGFQNDTGTPVIVGSLKASGIGINLQAAHKVAVFGAHWTWATLQQAIDRVHRIGQTNSVSASIIIGKGTVQEDKINRAITRMLDGAMDRACK